MRIVIQRVLEGSVSVENVKVSQIQKGLVCLVGLAQDDSKELLKFWADKLCKLKLWHNEKDKAWSSSIMDNNYEILLVSQFTLNATLQGNKPDFRKSMQADEAREMFNYMVEQVKEVYQEEKVKTGVFQTHMHVGLVNDGPVTINVEEDGKDNNEVQKMIQKNKKLELLMAKQKQKKLDKDKDKQEENKEKQDIKEKDEGQEKKEEEKKSE